MILPIIAPYVVTSFAIVAIISVNEYLISSFISGFTVETLPIKIFNNVRYGYTPVLAAAAIGFAAVTVGVLVLASLLYRCGRAVRRLSPRGFAMKVLTPQDLTDLLSRRRHSRHRRRRGAG